METRYAIEGLFGSEFKAIGNYCGVSAIGSLKTRHKVNPLFS